MMYLITVSDEFELKFSELSQAELIGSQAKLSWGILIFEPKPSWQYVRQ